MMHCLLLCSLLAASAEWKQLAAISPEKGASAVERDIYSHTTAAEQRAGFDSDPTTALHETCHMLNNRIASLATDSDRPITGLYLWNGWCVVLKNPSIRLSSLRQYVPYKLRGTSYDLYFVRQAVYYDNSPYYMFDEWVSYLHGLAGTIGYAESSGNVYSGAANARFCLEASIRCIAVLEGVDRAKQRGELGDFDAEPSKEVFRALWERQYLLLKIATKKPELSSGDPLGLCKIFTYGMDSDIVRMRSWFRAGLGSQWAYRYIGESDE